MFLFLLNRTLIFLRQISVFEFTEIKTKNNDADINLKDHVAICEKNAIVGLEIHENVIICDG